MLTLKIFFGAMAKIFFPFCVMGVVIVFAYLCNKRDRARDARQNQDKLRTEYKFSEKDLEDFKGWTSRIDRKKRSKK